MLITEPGRVRLMSPEDYHADPCPEPSLSSHVAHILIKQSPRHAWESHPRLNPDFQSDDKHQFDIGRVAHALMLREGIGDLVIVDADSWRTKVAQQQRDEAYAHGKTPLLRHEADEVAAMVNAGQLQLAQTEACWAFSDGAPEQTLIWIEKTACGPIWCRARLDWFPRLGNMFYDYKTTAGSAHPDAFFNSAWDKGYYMQAAFYMRGIAAVANIIPRDFRFVVQESKRPFALSVCALSSGALGEAHEFVTEAIETWGRCLCDDRWPGYSTHIAFADQPPVWVQRRRDAQRERKELLIAGGEDPYRTMIEWQSPLT